MPIWLRKRDRPRVHVDWTPFDRGMLLAAIVATLGSWLVLAAAWSALPERIPIHFDLGGQPNGWGGRGQGILLPAVGTLMLVLLGVLARFPRLYNYPWRITPDNAAVQYRLARHFMVLLLAYLEALFLAMEWGMLAVARGAAERLPSPLLITIAGPLVLVLGYLLVAWAANRRVASGDGQGRHVAALDEREREETERLEARLAETVDSGRRAELIAELEAVAEKFRRLRQEVAASLFLDPGNGRFRPPRPPQDGDDL
jgi:Domain of unknown function (DUF1648)